AVILVLALTLPTTLILLLSGLPATQSRNPANRLFHTDAEIGALDWLNTHAPADSIVLSTIETGNYLPARTSLRAVIGHGPETIKLDMKQPQVQRFFAGDMSPEERRMLFDTYNVRYVIFPQGRNSPPSPDLKLIYDQDGYYIYEVLRQ